MDWRRLSGNRFFRWRPFIRRVALLRTIIHMWPPFTWLLLIYTMVAGGCAGSTAGGIKNVRLLLLLAQREK